MTTPHDPQRPWRRKRHPDEKLLIEHPDLSPRAAAAARRIACAICRGDTANWPLLLRRHLWARRRSPHTMSSYASTLSRWLRWSALHPIADPVRPRRHEQDAYLRTRPPSLHATERSALRAAHAALRWAYPDAPPDPWRLPGDRPEERDQLTLPTP